MKVVGTFLLGLVLYLAFLTWRFPYDALLARKVRQLESSTGASVNYTPVSAWPLRLKVKDLHLSLASGASLQFDSATVWLTTSGLDAELVQDEGKAEIDFGWRRLNVQLDKVECQTGSSQLGLASFTGTLHYNLEQHTGRGDLRMVVPKFQAPLPIPEAPLELGASFTILNAGTDKRPRSRIPADVHVVSQDQKFSGDGKVVIESRLAGQPTLSGDLRFESPMDKGVLQVGGTWKNPIFRVSSR